MMQGVGLVEASTLGSIPPGGKCFSGQVEALEGALVGGTTAIFLRN